MQKENFRSVYGFSYQPQHYIGEVLQLDHLLRKLQVVGQKYAAKYPRTFNHGGVTMLWPISIFVGKA